MPLQRQSTIRPSQMPDKERLRLYKELTRSYIQSEVDAKINRQLAAAQRTDNNRRLVASRAPKDKFGQPTEAGLKLYKSVSKEHTKAQRSTIDGHIIDTIGPFDKWPHKYQEIFQQTRLSNQQRFSLVVFFKGNNVTDDDITAWFSTKAMTKKTWNHIKYILKIYPEKSWKTWVVRQPDQSNK